MVFTKVSSQAAHRRSERPVLALLAAAAAMLVAGCEPETKADAPKKRPVRAIIVAAQGNGESISLTGHIQPQDEASLAFRISGRMIERPANIGDRVETGQVLAKLEPHDETNAVRSAQAAVAAAKSRLSRDRNDYQRQQTLLRQGHTTRVRYEQAEKAMLTAQSELEDAEARLNIAEDRLSYTVLKADAPGVITARGAEPGEVVQAGQMIVLIARQGGKDAVFDVPAALIQSAPADPEISVALTTNPSVRAMGRVREVAPQADPVTRTFRVKVGLTDPPAAMRLGSTVTGTMQLEATAGIEIPASALTSSKDQPAVWVVDPATKQVSLRSIEVARYDLAKVVVASGLEPEDIVVTAGVQALRPGQEVRFDGGAP
jgi:RND family efflux transporter MFP subunit